MDNPVTSTTLDTARVTALGPPSAVRYLPPELAAVPHLFEVPVEPCPPGLRFVYFLCQEGPSPPGWPPGLVLDYVGETATLARRIERHARGRRGAGLAPVARAYAAPVPAPEARRIEEAVIRRVAPPYCNARRSGYRAVDRAVLEAWGYGLP